MGRQCRSILPRVFFRPDRPHAVSVVSPDGGGHLVWPACCPGRWYRRWLYLLLHMVLSARAHGPRLARVFWHDQVLRRLARVVPSLVVQAGIGAVPHLTRWPRGDPNLASR